MTRRAGAGICWPTMAALKANVAAKTVGWRTWNAPGVWTRSAAGGSLTPLRHQCGSLLWAAVSTVAVAWATVCAAGEVDPSREPPEELEPRAPDDAGLSFRTSPPRPALRGGVSLGVQAGLSLARGRGYPNDAEKIGVREYETTSDLQGGVGGALWIATAVSDWLTIGVGGRAIPLGNGDVSGLDTGIQFRVEGYPLHHWGGSYCDLGVALTTGLGFYRLRRGDESLISASATSSFGLGVFYEWIHWGSLSLGPQVDFSVQHADGFTAKSAVGGWRTAWYVRP